MTFLPSIYLNAVVSCLFLPVESKERRKEGWLDVHYPVRELIDERLIYDPHETGKYHKVNAMLFEFFCYADII